MGDWCFPISISEVHATKKKTWNGHVLSNWENAERLWDVCKGSPEAHFALLKATTTFSCVRHSNATAKFAETVQNNCSKIVTVVKQHRSAVLELHSIAAFYSVHGSFIDTICTYTVITLKLYTSEQPVWRPMRIIRVPNIQYVQLIGKMLSLSAKYKHSHKVHVQSVQSKLHINIIRGFRLTLEWMLFYGYHVMSSFQCTRNTAGNNGV